MGVRIKVILEVTVVDDLKYHPTSAFGFFLECTMNLTS